MSDPEKLIYPNVLSSTKSGPFGDAPEMRYFAEALTNNHDTVIRTTVYWHTPEDGEPVLMIEVDDEDYDGPDPMDVRIRVRRNDGLLYEGTRADQEKSDGDIVAVRIEGELKEHDSFDEVGYDVRLFHRGCFQEGYKLFDAVNEEDHEVRRFELDDDNLPECPVCGRTIGNA